MYHLVDQIGEPCPTPPPHPSGNPGPRRGSSASRPGRRSRPTRARATRGTGSPAEPGGVHRGPAGPRCALLGPPPLPPAPPRGGVHVGGDPLLGRQPVVLPVRPRAEE